MTLRLKNGKLAHKMLLAPNVVETEILRDGPCENCACQLVSFRRHGGEHVYAILDPRPEHPGYLFIAEHTPDWCRRKRRTR